jgi:hypothetical protein
LTLQDDMREVFKDLLAVDGVRGVLFLTPSGERVFEEFSIGGSEPVAASDWYALVGSLGKAREAELVFERGRVYIRRTADGVLVVVMGLIAPSAVIRLNCDILLPAIREQKSTKGIRRLFKR